MLRDNEREVIFLDKEVKRAIKELINYSNRYGEKSFLEMKKYRNK